jgi:hypothetical protein
LLESANILAVLIQQKKQIKHIKPQKNAQADEGLGKFSKERQHEDSRVRAYHPGLD